MSKRQEIRDRRRKEKTRNRILVFGSVIVGALLITFALVLPSLNTARTAASATQAALNATPVPIVTVTPRTFTAKVDGLNLGDPNAPVKVVAYEDFRCSVCRLYTENIEPAIIQNYVDTGKIYYTYSFYLVIDMNDGADASYRAANAAMCASEQGHFWDYHDTLYANQFSEDASIFTDDRLVQMAQNIGLDMAGFNQCYQAKKYKSEIEKAMSQAAALNVSGPPSIFVDGTLVQNFQLAAQSIDAALAGK
jgi:protein-disulfide isomerase